MRAKVYKDPKLVVCPSYDVDIAWLEEVERPNEVQRFPTVSLQSSMLQWITAEDSVREDEWIYSLAREYGITEDQVLCQLVEFAKTLGATHRQDFSDFLGEIFERKSWELNR